MARSPREGQPLADPQSPAVLSSIEEWYTHRYTDLEDKCTYLRSFVVALCVAILVMVASRISLVPFPVATALIGVVAIALVITLIVHAVGNSNRYSMLFPEREWPLIIDKKQEDATTCAPLRGSGSGGSGEPSA